MEELKLSLDVVIDIPSSKDYQFSEFEEFASGITTPRPRDYIKVMDQKSSSLCTKYAEYYWASAYNILEDINNTGWVIRPQLDPGYIDDWIRSLQVRMDDAVKSWLIKWYLQIPKVWFKLQDWKIQTKENRIKQMKTALNSWFWLYTGTEYVKWTMAMSPILKFDTVKHTGHADLICWSDQIYHTTDKLFEFINSFWEKRWDKWYWYINENDVDKLFTIYVLIPMDHTWFFDNYKDWKVAQEIKKLSKWLYEKWTPDQQKEWNRMQVSKTLDKMYKL